MILAGIVLTTVKFVIAVDIFYVNSSDLFSWIAFTMDLTPSFQKEVTRKSVFIVVVFFHLLIFLNLLLKITWEFYADL